MERPPDRPHLLRRPEQEVDPERVTAAQEGAHARRRVPPRVDRQRERDHLPAVRAGKQPQRGTDVAREDRALRLAIGVEERDDDDLSPEAARAKDVAAIIAEGEGRQPNARRWLAATVGRWRWTTRVGTCIRSAGERVDEQSRGRGYDDDRGDQCEQEGPLHRGPRSACLMPPSSSFAEISPILCTTIRPPASRK